MFPSTYQLYTINLPKYWLVRDKPEENLANRASLLFHIMQDDYFSTLATILGFFEESIVDKNITNDMRDLQLKSIKGVTSDLIYLNKNYKIVRKDKNKDL